MNMQNQNWDEDDDIEVGQNDGTGWPPLPNQNLNRLQHLVKYASQDLQRI